MKGKKVVIGSLEKNILIYLIVYDISLLYFLNLTIGVHTIANGNLDLGISISPISLSSANCGIDFKTIK